MAELEAAQVADRGRGGGDEHVEVERHVCGDHRQRGERVEVERLLRS
jgi:hypothetical protein